MNIPPRLKRLLEKKADLSGATSTSVAAFETWLGARQLFFFPEYTDHGVTHVERVLRGADWLLSDGAGKVLTSEDSAVLVLAAILHDCAMHITKDGFLTLVNRESTWPPRTGRLLEAMKDARWRDLWEGFLREASRWDDQKRVALFGQARPVRRPPEGSEPWNEDDQRFVGEFLRRHHARLAHEIATCGVPGPAGDRLEFTGVDPWMRDLAGLVARSHGVALRPAIDRLAPEDRADMRGVHAPLLMCLLRIADYLEIDKPRAPAVLLKVRSLQSPVSRQEWAKHQAVAYLKVSDQDPEAIWIDAEPTTLETFVGLQNLFAGLQGELDASWAVLGEIYKKDSRFGLRIRRVRSTLDDAAEFAKHVNYIPVRAAFESAGGDLLKLLVGPLYNHQPAYGIRELIQNAVDACRELDDLLDHGHAAVDRSELEADVVVTVLEEDANGGGWITVDDRGIGMNTEVITNYFLKAGASLRNSEAWHRLHDDPQGQTRVSRSGRFGLGVLATFLLGDEVHVTTRHADEPPERGIEFDARLDSPRIELMWCKRRVGTTIRVHVIRRDVFDALANAESWDWYRLPQPSLIRRIRLQQERIRTRTRIPAVVDVKLEQAETICHRVAEPAPPWRRLETEGFRDVLWSLRHPAADSSDVANGIALRPADAVGGWWPVLWPEPVESGDLFLFRPRLAAMEGTSLVPVDLRRTMIAGRLPFRDELVNALCRDVLASLLVRAADTREVVVRQIARATPGSDFLVSLAHPGVSTDRNEHRTKMPGRYHVRSWLFVSEKGLALEDPAAQADDRQGVAFLVVREDDRHLRDDEPLARALNRVPAGFPIGIQSTLSVAEELEEHRVGGGYASGVMVLPTRDWQLEKARGAAYRRVTASDAGKGWTIVWTGEDPTGRLDLGRLDSGPQDDDLGFVLYVLPRNARPRNGRNPLSSLWQQLAYHTGIPYEHALRKLALARAFDELRKEIELWQGLNTVEAVARWL